MRKCWSCRENRLGCMPCVCPDCGAEWCSSEEYDECPECGYKFDGREEDDE